MTGPPPECPYDPFVTRVELEEAIGRDIEQLSRAPFFVLHPEALVAVRDEMRRIRAGRGTDLELEEDDDVWAVVDSARRLEARLVEMRLRLDEAGREQLELFTAERLVEASLRYA
jgi:hypothetical protein